MIAVKIRTDRSFSCAVMLRKDGKTIQTPWTPSPNILAGMIRHREKETGCKLLYVINASLKAHQHDSSPHL